MSILYSQHITQLRKRIESDTSLLAILTAKPDSSDTIVVPLTEEEKNKLLNLIATHANTLPIGEELKWWSKLSTKLRLY